MRKKIKMIILLSVMAVSLVACGEDNGVQKNEADTTLPETGSEDSNLDVSKNEDLDNGYEIVDEINIDTNEIALKYTGYEIVDGTGENEEEIKEAIIYFDFSNKTSISERIHEAINISVFQNGIELTNWLGDVEGNESVSNSYEYIIDGANLNVGLLFELKDVENPIKIRVENSFSEIYGENGEMFAQEQELNLK